MRLFPEKLQIQWDELLIMKKEFQHGAIELIARDGTLFKVNGHQVKYYEERIPIEENEGEIVKLAVVASM